MKGNLEESGSGDAASCLPLEPEFLLLFGVADIVEETKKFNHENQCIQTQRSPTRKRTYSELWSKQEKRFECYGEEMILRMCQADTSSSHMQC